MSASTTALTFASNHRRGPSTRHESVEQLGDRIATLAAHLHAAEYHLLVLIREFDEREGWGE